MSEDLLLRAGWVLPVSTPPIRDGVVAISRNRVAWVGAAGSRERPAGAERDLGPGVLVPGPVNAHTHLELSALAGRVPAEEGYTQWVEALVESRAALSAAYRQLAELRQQAFESRLDAADRLDQILTAEQREQLRRSLGPWWMMDEAE